MLREMGLIANSREGHNRICVKSADFYLPYGLDKVPVNYLPTISFMAHETEQQG